MKFKIAIAHTIIASCLLVITSCSAPENKNKTVIIHESDIIRKTIGVKGMTCVGCEVTLETNIAKIPGVVQVKASAANNEAIIEFDSTKIDIATITSIIKDSGYKPFSNSEKQ